MGPFWKGAVMVEAVLVGAVLTCNQKLSWVLASKKYPN